MPQVERSRPPTGPGASLSARERLALEQAASGHVSGRLWEWPELRGAFEALGMDVDPDAPLSAMRTLARAALEVLGDAPAPSRAAFAAGAGLDVALGEA